MLTLSSTRLTWDSVAHPLSAALARHRYQVGVVALGTGGQALSRAQGHTGVRGVLMEERKETNIAFYYRIITLTVINSSKESSLLLSYYHHNYYKYNIQRKGTETTMKKKTKTHTSN